jgi:hypothetical protein
MCDLHQFVPDSLSPMFRYLRKPFPTKQPTRVDSGTEDMWNPESPFHASTSGDFVFELPNQPIALLPPFTNDQSSVAGRAENGDFCSLRRGERTPCCFVRACVAAAGQRWRYPSTYRRQMQLHSSRYNKPGEGNFRHPECLHAAVDGGDWIFFLPFQQRVGGKRRGAFLAFSCQVGQHCILRVIKVPCKSPETARLATFHHPCALAGSCDDNQAGL